MNLVNLLKGCALWNVTDGEIVGHPRLHLIGDQKAAVYDLRISNASLNDDGEYQCQVGPLGGIRPIRANAHLVVICEFVFSVKLLLPVTRWKKWIVKGGPINEYEGIKNT